MKRYHHRIQKESYEPGELVLVRNTRLEDHLTRFKTRPRYLGPYEVVRRTPNGTYVIKELDGAVHSDPYAAFRIIKYLTRNDPLLEFQEELDTDEFPGDVDSENFFMDESFAEEN
ncbi:hypothetical protein PLEOSDRAFT_1033431 [Pleurotus ostreatus PC15]|uniref:Uncharacterized protein n=1 Tax=Pleurotus ostreatus (strain PC15) TaxID=1137138 RepID=A0A067PDV5_PLEO1|nr:hypothetical protein PLEOSDRAFT_1033431 [Pleurotus ostreatus PC15]